MAYTQRADIYLGDVSSQVYEFLLNPRPCVFLNPRRFDWRETATIAADVFVRRALAEPAT